MGILVLMITVYFCLKLLISVDYGMHYLVSTESAPGGSLIVTELHSLSESGHAPYGQYLVLSRKQVTTPDKGFVIFAGYCNSLSYSWISNTEIFISCDSGNSDTIRTKSIRALGVEIIYQ